MTVVLYAAKKSRIDAGAFDIIGDFIEYRNPELALRIFEDENKTDEVKKYFANLEEQIIQKDLI